jgi:hypothetical protein
MNNQNREVIEDPNVQKQYTTESMGDAGPTDIFEGDHESKGFGVLNKNLMDNQPLFLVPVMKDNMPVATGIHITTDYPAGGTVSGSLAELSQMEVKRGGIALALNRGTTLKLTLGTGGARAPITISRCTPINPQ